MNHPPTSASATPSARAPIVAADLKLSVAPMMDWTDVINKAYYINDMEPL